MYHTFPFIQLDTLDVKYNDKMGPSGCPDIVVELKGYKERERGGRGGELLYLLSLSLSLAVAALPPVP